MKRIFILILFLAMIVSCKTTSKYVTTGDTAVADSLTATSVFNPTSQDSPTQIQGKEIAKATVTALTGEVKRLNDSISVLQDTIKKLEQQNALKDDKIKQQQKTIKTLFGVCCVIFFMLSITLFLFVKKCLHK